MVVGIAVCPMRWMDHGAPVDWRKLGFDRPRATLSKAGSQEFGVCICVSASNGGETAAGYMQMQMQVRPMHR